MLRKRQCPLKSFSKILAGFPNRLDKSEISGLIASRKSEEWGFLPSGLLIRQSDPHESVWFGTVWRDAMFWHICMVMHDFTQVRNSEG